MIIGNEGQGDYSITPNYTAQNSHSVISHHKHHHAVMVNNGICDHPSTTTTNNHDGHHHHHQDQQQQQHVQQAKNRGEVEMEENQQSQQHKQKRRRRGAKKKNHSASKSIEIDSNTHESASSSSSKNHDDSNIHNIHHINNNNHTQTQNGESHDQNTMTNHEKPQASSEEEAHEMHDNEAHEQEVDQLDDSDDEDEDDTKSCQSSNAGDNYGDVRLNEICILHVNAAKYNRKFLQKYFMKNFGRVIKANLYMEDSTKASVVIRFEDASVAQSLVDSKEICFAPLEKNPIFHKIKHTKIVKKAQTKKKKRRKTNKSHAQPILSSIDALCDKETIQQPLQSLQQQLLQLQERGEEGEIVVQHYHHSQVHVENQERVDGTGVPLLLNMMQTGDDSVIDHFISEGVICSEETSSIVDDCSSIVSNTSCEPVTAGDPIDIKKKKRKKTKKSSRDTSTWKSVMINISKNRRTILSFAFSYHPDQHEKMAYDLSQILYGGEAEMEVSDSESSIHMLSNKIGEANHSVLYEEFTIFNFLLFMNVMSNPELTYVILQECERLKSQIEQTCKLPTISSPQKISLITRSQNSYARFLNTSQYCLKYELENLMKDILPTKQEKYHNQNFIKTIEKACGQVFSGIYHKISPYGSSANGFSMRGSDIDLALNFEESSQVGDASTVLSKLKKKLLSDGIHGAKVIGQRLPILKIHHFNVECDICVNNYFAVVNTQFLLTFSKLDKMLKEVVHMIKYWAKNVGINESAHGTLSSYSYVLMVIFYFQNIGRLPSLHKLLDHPYVVGSDIANQELVLGNDCRYVSNVATVKRIMNSEMVRNNSTGTDLVIGFFSFYKQFDFNKHTICLKSGTPIEKKTWSKDILISIIDPFEYQRDLGCVIASRRKAENIISEISEAANILSSGGIMQDVIEASIARQFAFAAKQLDKSGTFRRYPSPQVLEKLKNNKNFAAGVLSIESLDPVRAFVKLDTTGDVIAISTIGALNRALHTDYVFIKKNTATHGQIVTILKKNSPKVFACVAEVHPDYVWMKPIDSRFPKMITTTLFFAKTINCKHKQALKYNGFVFACQMDSWKDNERYPQIHSFEVLGCALDPLTANRFMVFNESQYMSSDKSITQSAKMSREQYTEQRRPKSINSTHRPIFSICSSDSSTIAFSAEDRAESIHIYVYLPDIYSYCSNIDPNRLFAVNLGHSVLSIVDPKLASLCNFETGQERNAICISWQIDKNTLNVSNSQVFFTYIRSSCSLRMGQLQKILNGQSCAEHAHFEGMIHMMRQVVRSYISLTQPLSQFRFVFSSFTGIPLDIENCRDAQEMVRMYELATSRVLLGCLDGFSKKKYFGSGANFNSNNEQLELISSQLKHLSCVYPNLPIHHRLLSQIGSLEDGPVKQCAEYRANQGFSSQMQWRFSNVAQSLQFEFTNPSLSFPHLYAHKLLESFCLNGPEKEWTVERGDIDSKLDELNQWLPETLRIEQQAYYHNLSSFLLHHSKLEHRTVNAVVIDGIVSPMMELALFLPRYGIEVKCHLTRLQPCPSSIELDEHERTTKLNYFADTSSDEELGCDALGFGRNEDVSVELKPFSVIKVELTVDMRYYPQELFVRKISCDDDDT